MPHSNDTDGDVVEAILTADARIIAGEFENRRRIPAGRRRGRPADGRSEPVRAGRPTARDEAAQELDLACVLVIGAAEAATSLGLLENGPAVDPEGALVFACLLHVVGHTGAAEFWWRFGAGGGSRTAAYCLHLSHRRDGEFRDAAFWRAEAAHDPDGERGPRPAGPVDGRARPLPEAARHALLVQWHSGLTPHLPAALESVVNRLAVIGDDADFGEVPRPDPGLVARFSREG